MKATPRVRVAFEVTLALTEPEARALDALAGYQTEAFLKMFYEHLGSAYMKPYEGGLRTLFESIHEQIRPQLSQVDHHRDLLASAAQQAGKAGSDG